MAFVRSHHKFLAVLSSLLLTACGSPDEPNVPAPNPEPQPRHRLRP